MQLGRTRSPFVMTICHSMRCRWPRRRGSARRAGVRAGCDAAATSTSVFRVRQVAAGVAVPPVLSHQLMVSRAAALGTCRASITVPVTGQRRAGAALTMSVRHDEEWLGRRHADAPSGWCAGPPEGYPM